MKENPQQSLKLITDSKTVEKTFISTAKLDVNKRCRSHSRVNEIYQMTDNGNKYWLSGDIPIKISPTAIYIHWPNFKVNCQGFGLRVTKIPVENPWSVSLMLVAYWLWEHELIINIYYSQITNQKAKLFSFLNVWI